MFSRPTQHALRALAFLAQQPPGKLAGAREIAAAGQIPPPFLWKILRTLARRRLLRSFKGMRGGYELARPARRIPLEKILRAMGEKEILQHCVLGLPRCRPKQPCPLHSAKDKLHTALSQATLLDLANTFTPSGARKPFLRRPTSAGSGRRRATR